MNDSRPTGKHVQLMATCLCDALFDDTAIAAVEVLEHLGCTVEVSPAQTCCGQAAFNAGDWPAARKVIRHILRAFPGDAPIVVPSASCAAMLFHGALLAFENEPELPEVRRLAKRVWEFGDYIVNALGVTNWRGRFDAKAVFHRSCHARGTLSGEAATKLLGTIDGLTLLPFDESEQCCGFGGVFSVAFPNISKSIGNLKLDNLLAAAPDLVISIDQSCLMNLSGLASKSGRPVKTRHIAQVLRDALNNTRQAAAA